MPPGQWDLFVDIYTGSSMAQRWIYQVVFNSPGAVGRIDTSIYPGFLYSYYVVW